MISFGTLAWHKIHEDIAVLVMLAHWKPWEVSRLTVRDRNFWLGYYKAIEERKRMDAVTQHA